jgi:hypothetical protein
MWGHQTYSSVVSRDSVRIAFLIAALNDLEVSACDISGAYLNAETKEKVYTMARPEFETNKGRPALIVRAIYGLKSSNAQFRAQLARREAWKPDGTKYYKYVLTYACTSLDPMKIVKGLEDFYLTKTRRFKGSFKGCQNRTRQG